MKIRKSNMEDLERIMEIYAYARSFMAEHGNPNQWGPTNWPPQALIENDIRIGKSYVCINEEGTVIGTFFYDFGEDIEPCYRVIEEGSWRRNAAYGVVHRVAADGSRKGIGRYCLNWAFEQCGSLRIDTHSDNVVMQKLLESIGFEKRGIIHVEEDNYPRFAYEKF
ncbi:MAG: GNAT family N-acetyltransferase [Eubacteriales bacterium]|nr:GNAT family N-acetyltransferase [Eubacteriales bacterium]